MANPKVVTIDGPAGAGKSSVARQLADRLGWKLLDTGAMYRAVTLAALRQSLDLASDQELGRLADQVVVEFSGQQILLDGEDITQAIRELPVTRATQYSANSPSVRRRLVQWQRDFANAQGAIVTEGRDQGTIVFSDAFCKFYLTASDEERARRRLDELLARGTEISFEVVLREMIERDTQDAARSIAPMKPATDARVIDSTGLDFGQVVNLLEADIRRSLVLLSHKLEIP